MCEGFWGEGAWDGKGVVCPCPPVRDNTVTLDDLFSNKCVVDQFETYTTIIYVKIYMIFDTRIFTFGRPVGLRR